MSVAANSVYIKNLSPLVTEENIQDAFKSCEDILRVIFRQFPGSTQRYCQVDFSSSAGVTRALQMNNEVILGVPMVISVIDPVNAMYTQPSSVALGGPVAAAAAAAAANLLAGSAGPNGPTVAAPNLSGGVPGVTMPPPDILAQIGSVLPQRQESEDDQLARTVHISGLPKDWSIDVLLRWLASTRIATAISDHRFWDEENGFTRSALLELGDPAAVVALMQLPEALRSVKSLSCHSTPTETNVSGVRADSQTNAASPLDTQADGTVLKILPAKATVSPRVPINVSFNIPAAATLPVAYQQMGKIRLEEKLARVRALRDQLSQKLSNPSKDRGTTHVPNGETQVSKTDGEESEAKQSRTSDAAQSVTDEESKRRESASPPFGGASRQNHRRDDYKDRRGDRSPIHRRGHPHGRPWWVNHRRPLHGGHSGRPRQTYHGQDYVDEERYRHHRRHDAYKSNTKSARGYENDYPRHRHRSREDEEDLSPDSGYLEARVGRDRESDSSHRRHGATRRRVSRSDSSSGRRRQRSDRRGDSVKRGGSRGREDYSERRDSRGREDYSERRSRRRSFDQSTRSRSPDHQTRRSSREPVDSDDDDRGRRVSVSPRDAKGRRDPRSFRVERSRAQSPSEDSHSDEIMSEPSPVVVPVISEEEPVAVRRMEAYDAYMDNE